VSWNQLILDDGWWRNNQRWKISLLRTFKKFLLSSLKCAAILRKWIKPRKDPNISLWGQNSWRERLQIRQTNFRKYIYIIWHRAWYFSGLWLTQIAVLWHLCITHNCISVSISQYWSYFPCWYKGDSILGLVFGSMPCYHWAMSTHSVLIALPIYYENCLWCTKS